MVFLVTKIYLSTCSLRSKFLPYCNQASWLHIASDMSSVVSKISIALIWALTSLGHFTNLLVVQAPSRPHGCRASLYTLPFDLNSSCYISGAPIDECACFLAHNIHPGAFSPPYPESRCELRTGFLTVLCARPIPSKEDKLEQHSSLSGLFADTGHVICLSLCSSWSSSLDARGV